MLFRSFNVIKKFKSNFLKKKVKRGGAGMKNSHTRPAPFNFLNGTGMRIVFNKWGAVRMSDPSRTRPVAIPR